MHNRCNCLTATLDCHKTHTMLDRVIRTIHIRRSSAADGRYHKIEARSTDQISDEDLLQYTGMTRCELLERAKKRRTTANQAGAYDRKGKVSGFRGYESAAGYGGWGWA